MVFVYRNLNEWSNYTIVCIGVEPCACIPNSPRVDVSLFSSPFSTHVSITFTRYFNGLGQKNIFLATMKKEE
ncbi:hypothetical protein DVH24_024305 [Malus domestica]|uniref:Uncharacterized protein n=1 Tax=Malus domestica TaxID=3750 RepID=A0A498JMS2_MALDO|nr:hypothetical protein DVH24_024305 [Malus domestica]